MKKVEKGVLVDKDDEIAAHVPPPVCTWTCL